MLICEYSEKLKTIKMVARGEPLRQGYDVLREYLVLKTRLDPRGGATPKTANESINLLHNEQKSQVFHYYLKFGSDS